MKAMSFSIERKKTRRIRVGNIEIGDMAPISVQSMTNTFTHDIPATVSQIKRLEEAGCEIVRLAVPDEKAAKATLRGGDIITHVDKKQVKDLETFKQMVKECIDSGLKKIFIKVRRDKAINFILIKND